MGIKLEVGSGQEHSLLNLSNIAIKARLFCSDFGALLKVLIHIEFRSEGKFSMDCGNKGNDDIGSILNHASLLMKNSEFDEAIQTLERAIDRYPCNRGLWEQVIACNIELKKPKQAIIALDRMLSIEPNQSQVWADKAFLHLLLSEVDEGIAALENSLGLYPRNASGWQLLAMAYMGGEEWDRAASALEKAIQLNPNSGIIWYNYAACKFIMGENQEAIAAAEYSFSLNPGLEQYADDWIDFARDERSMNISLDSFMASAG
ncbi:tetratricopeptide repeat protein [Candidatus Thorarchaeota archaeon]|nr:MAG: tetratricopeptide repeat protein [Candidatus Thorarchaeota archaeon]